MKHGFKPHSVIRISPNRITIRNIYWTSLRKRVIPLEKLKRINVVNLWNKMTTLEFVTVDERIRLHGNYGEAHILRKIILQILVNPTIVIQQKGKKKIKSSGISEALCPFCGFDGSEILDSCELSDKTRIVERICNKCKREYETKVM